MSMYKFTKPTVGSTVTVTTRHPETNLWSDNDYRDNTYHAEVLKPEPWFGPNDFKIAGDDPKTPWRVINLNNVIELDVDGNGAHQHSTDDHSYTVTVNGSKGKTYTVTVKDGTAVSCTCPQFQFRRAACKHMNQAVTADKHSYVDTNGSEEDNMHQERGSYSFQKQTRRSSIMGNSTLSWNDRFALIERFNPTDEQACNVFGISQDELDAARNMKDSGAIPSSSDIDVEAYSSWFDGVGSAQTTTTKSGSATSTKKSTSNKGSNSQSKSGSQKSSTKTSTKKTTSKKGGSSTSTKSPGRRGNKIENAFDAISTTPQPAEQVAQQHGVSLAVLRQSKRFDKYPDRGSVRVKKDKQSGDLMVWREEQSNSATSDSSGNESTA